MINKIQNQAQCALDSTLSKTGYDSYETNLDILPEASDALIASSVCYKISQDCQKSPSELAAVICELPCPTRSRSLPFAP